MNEILELRNRLTDVEAELASNTDALTAAIGGTVVGAIIAGVVAYLLYRLQQTTSKYLYELQKLEQLTRDLENLRVMFAQFDGEIVGQMRGKGDDKLRNPQYNDFYAVPINLGLNNRYDLKLENLNQMCLSVIETGTFCFVNIGTPEMQNNFDKFHETLEELMLLIDVTQAHVSKAMQFIVKKL